MPHYLTIHTFVLNLQAVQVVAKGHMQIQQGSKARTTSHYTSSIGNRKWYHNEAGYLYTSLLCSLLSERNFSHHHKFWPGATPSCGRQCSSLQEEHLIAQSTPQCLKQTSEEVRQPHSWIVPAQWQMYTEDCLVHCILPGGWRWMLQQQSQLRKPCSLLVMKTVIDDSQLQVV